MKSIKVIKNRSDIGAGTRGSDMGIDAMEIAAIKANDDFFGRFPILDLKTNNEAIYNKVTTPYGKRITEIVDQCQRVSNSIKDTLSEGSFPLIISGDHSSALGTLSGIKAQYPNKRVAAIWIDAHADLHSVYTSPSGNVHGMPLAAALGEDNLPGQINEIDDNTATQWNNYKNIGNPS
jgi:arginase